ncbi:holin [Glycomyces artemisiae]|uniref:Phage r1t holin n=1 Tax=Glycomyces artemisiae TaxID=1076443 RepID=A0A2T0UEQ5_9ACTN|nr:holin [Glycomyces artemisiae]PRY56420.1 phage r1t holin [Glycomyces artemisiae]
MSKSKYYTTAFWVETGDRAIKTFGGTWFAVLTADAIRGLRDVDWVDSWSIVGLAVGASVAWSIGSAPVGTAGSASMIPLGAVKDTTTK